MIVITMVKKTTKRAAKSNERGGFADIRAGSAYDTEAAGVVLTLMRILAMCELKEQQQQQQQQQQVSLLVWVFLVLQWCK
jgi:hypothetical protein